MRSLGIPEGDLVEGSYLDLLNSRLSRTLYGV